MSGDHMEQKLCGESKEAFLAAEAKAEAKHPLTCRIEGEQLVIRIGLDTLKLATEFSPQFANEYYDKHGSIGGDGPYVEVVDRDELGRDIVRALQHEEEDGTTPIHKLLDHAMVEARDDGSLAFKEDEDA